jgi:hypothetical protein
MTTPNTMEQEVAHLAAETDRLRKERDAYREELNTIRSRAEESISAQLRLLSVNLTKEIREDFFACCAGLDQWLQSWV